MPYIGKKPADIIATVIDTTTGTFSGEVDAGSLDVSGNADIDGITNLDNTDIDGTLDVSGNLTVDTNTLHVDSANNKVGIGTSSPISQLSVVGANSGFEVNGDSGSSNARLLAYDRNVSAYRQMDFNALAHIFQTSNTERMRIDTSGNLLVGKTSTSGDVVGHRLSSDGRLLSTADSNYAVQFNRKTSDGSIAEFRKDGTTVGTISTQGGTLEVGSGDVYLQFNGTNDWIKPVDGSGSNKVNVDLGTSGAKFKDLYLSNSVRLKGATRDISIQQDNYGLRVYDNDASSERFRIDASGNIGIGTSSPDKLVHLKTAVNNTAVLRIESTATDSYPFLSLKNDAREYQLTAHGPLGDVFTIYDGTSGNHRFVINSSGNVGIGTTSISSSDRLSINGGNARIVNSVAQSGNTLDNSTFSGLIVNNSNDANGDLAGIVMYPTSQYTAAAGVFGVRESQTAAGISFWSGSNTGSERMRIDSSGNLLVGTTSTIPFTLTSGTGAGITSAGTIMGGATAEAGLFNRVGGDGNIINFYRTGSIVGNIGAAGARLFINSGNVGLNFAGDGSNQILPSNAGVNRDDAITLGTTNVRFKDLYLSGGIYLGGTGSANYLDEYEEGSLSLSVATGTASFAYAKYTKVGNLVTIRFQMLTISDQSSSSNLLVTGLPFTSTAANQSTSGILSRYFNGGGDAYIAYISASSSQVQFFQTVNNGNYHQVRHVDLTNTNANAYVTISYETT